jgi:hypothetical protein
MAVSLILEITNAAKSRHFGAMREKKLSGERDVRP